MKDLLLSICICLHIIYTLHDHYIYKYCLTTLSRCRDMNTSFFNFSLHFLSSGQLLCFNNHMGKYTRIYLYIYHIDLNLILFSSFSRTSEISKYFLIVFLVNDLVSIKNFVVIGIPLDIGAFQNNILKK